MSARLYRTLAFPIHGFIIGARSPLFRDALKDYRRSGSNNNTDLFHDKRREKIHDHVQRP